MRTISAALKAAQQSSSYTPYTELVFYSPDSTIAHNYSSRLVLGEHTEKLYDDSATLVLKNQDLGIVDIEGYWTEIGYGIVGDTAPTPRLWVMSQSYISVEGQLVSVLELGGVWHILAMTLMRLGKVPFYTGTALDAEAPSYTATTIYDIIAAVLVLASDTNFTFQLLAVGSGQDDGIMSTLAIDFYINKPPFESAADLIARLMYLTNSYLRAKPGLLFEVRYPQDTDLPTQQYVAPTPTTGSHHVFKEYAEVKNIKAPNHVVVFANPGEDELWTNIVTGEYDDSAGRFREVYHIEVATELTTQAQADAFAKALNDRAQSEKLGGRLIIPQDASLETLDMVSIRNQRGK